MTNGRRVLAVARTVLALTLLASARQAGAGEGAGPGRKFVFGVGTPQMLYTDDRGYGFEAGAKVDAVAGCCTSDSPFFFSAALPEGNYRVTVTLGNPIAESTTTVKAELRRLMLEQVHTAAGESATRTLSSTCAPRRSPAAAPCASRRPARPPTRPGRGTGG